MIPERTFILKTSYDLNAATKHMKKVLQKINKLSFWKRHYKSHNFKFEPKKFNWDYWQNIPFSSSSDFNQEGTGFRLKDARLLLKNETMNFVLSNPKNTQEYMQLVFLIHAKKIPSKESDSWKVQISKSYSMSLQRVLFSIISKKPKVLIINSAHLNYNLKSILDQLQISSLYLGPKELPKFTNSLYDIRMKQNLKRVVLTKLALSRYDIQSIRQLFGNAKIQVQYPSITARLFRQCLYAQKRYGINAVHPKKRNIVELYKINSSGWGEIVVTKTFPIEFSYIRYRTGLLGKAVFEKCECGGNWILIPMLFKKPLSPLKLPSVSSINIGR